MNFLAKFAYEFSSKGIHGLLAPRTVKAFMTTGGPTWVYQLGLLPAAKAFKRSLKNCGFKVKVWKIFGSNMNRSEAEHQVWLKEVAAWATK